MLTYHPTPGVHPDMVRLYPPSLVRLSKQLKAQRKQRTRRTT